MKNSYFYMFLIFSTLVFFTTGCDYGKSDSYGKKKAENEKTMNEKPKAEIASLVDGGAISVSSEVAGGPHNRDGIGHFKEGHWDIAETHFRKAIEANPELAEAHYNLALSLDKLGNHGDATKHFKKALDLAPDNPKIKDSKILMAHVGM